MSAQWSEEQTRMLIDERKNGNEEYYRTPNRNKRNFWEDIANEINRANNTNYFTGEDCNKKFLSLTRTYYTAKAYKEAVANAEAVLREGPANAETNEGAMVKVKNKRSIIGEHYYEEFSTEFWKERGRQRHNVGAINVGTTTSNTPNRSQQSRIPRPIVATSSTSTSGSRTASGTGTTSKIPRAIPSPNRSRPTTPSIPSSGSRSVTPSFSQSAETINIFINYNEPDDQE